MRALSVISLLILISIFAVSCGEKKGTDPTPNKGRVTGKLKARILILLQIL